MIFDSTRSVCKFFQFVRDDTDIALVSFDKWFIFIFKQVWCPRYTFLKIEKKCSVCIYGLNSHLKSSFKSILEKHQIFTLRSHSFVCYLRNLYRSASIPKNLLFPQKFLFLRLICSLYYCT